MDIYTMITIISAVVTLISIIAGIIIIIWFFKDMHRESSELLKEITAIKEEIVEGQRKWLETLNKGLENNTIPLSSKNINKN